MSDNILIDEQFENRLPPHTDDERAMLSKFRTPDLRPSQICRFLALDDELEA